MLWCSLRYRAYIYIPGMLHACMFDLCTQINIIHNITRKQLSVRMSWPSHRYCLIHHKMDTSYGHGMHCADNSQHTTGYMQIQYPAMLEVGFHVLHTAATTHYRPHRSTKHWTCQKQRCYVAQRGPTKPGRHTWLKHVGRESRVSPLVEAIEIGEVFEPPLRDLQPQTQSNKGQTRYRKPPLNRQEDTVYTVGSLQR